MKGSDIYVFCEMPRSPTKGGALAHLLDGLFPQLQGEKKVCCVRIRHRFRLKFSSG